MSCFPADAERCVPCAVGPDLQLSGVEGPAALPRPRLPGESRGNSVWEVSSLISRSGIGNILQSQLGDKIRARGLLGTVLRI